MNCNVKQGTIAAADLTGRSHLGRSNVACAVCTPWTNTSASAALMSLSAPGMVAREPTGRAMTSTAPASAASESLRSPNSLGKPDQHP